ncbi:MAG: hypothetical protein ACT4NL_00355 [Pseudomarimonas sp.]
MQGSRADLLKLTPEALAQLANLGLVKRAQRELAAGYVPILELLSDGTLVAVFPDQVRSEFGAGAGLKDARCSCGAALCRHRIAAVLHYTESIERAPADEVFAAADFGSLDESLIRAFTATSLWPLVDRELRKGVRIEVERTQSGDRRSEVFTARLPQATARYYAGADLAFAHCDCVAQQRCEHIALGALALAKAGPLAEARLAVELGDPHDRAALPAAFSPTPFLQLIESLLHEGLAHGAAQSPVVADTLSRALRASSELGATWLSLCLQAIEQWLALYQHRSARFAYADGLQLLRELSLRLAVAAAGAELPARGLLGLGEAMETPLDRLSLMSLGIRVHADGRERRATLAVIDCDTQTLLCLHKQWQRAADDPSSELAKLDQQRVAGTLRLSRLALGSLVTTTAKRRANLELKLGQSFAGKASISAHNGDWSALRAPLLIEDQAAWLRQQAHALPRELQPRSALPGFHVLRVAKVLRIGFDPARQCLHASLLDPSGAPWWLRRDYSAVAPGALDAIAGVLKQAQASDASIQIAGPVRRCSEGLVIEPWALSAGRLVVPDLFGPDGSVSALLLADAPAAVDDPLAQWLSAVDDSQCELLRDGLGRCTSTPRRLNVLARRARELGLGAAEPLLAELSTQLHHYAGRNADGAMAAFRALMHWTALAGHAAAAIDFEHTLIEHTLEESADATL